MENKSNMTKEPQTHKTKPIKRNPAIINFSREHHFGLLLCWKIRQGIKKGTEPARIAAYTSFFFENDLKKHFADEERLLFPALLPDHPFRIRAEADHRVIRERMHIVERGKVDAAFLSSLADYLENHIRFEERIMFNFIQQQLGEEKLAAIEAQYRQKPEDLDKQWEDHFWEIKK